MEHTYQLSIDWLTSHQNPSKITDDMNIAVLFHPRSDGDGMATRIGRLVGRIVPYIMKGVIVILEGGFRGYTHPETGFESLFKPFSNIRKDKDGKYFISDNSVATSEWVQDIPPSLKDKNKNWWYGVILNYFLRPNESLGKYIQDKMARMSILPNTKYIGLHIRRGDNPVGLEYELGDYLDVLRKQVIPFWKGKQLAPPIPNIYVATDSSDILKIISFKKFEDFQLVLEPTQSLDMSYPGQSAANIMIRNENDVELVMKIAYEVIADIIILSNSAFLVGIMTSQITKIAAAMAGVRGNSVHIPIALDYLIRIDWVRSNVHEMYHGDITPFCKPSD
jgi:hypothetical protein